MRGRGSGDDDRMHEEANGDDEEDVYEEDGQLIIPTSDSREEELDNDADDNGASKASIHISQSDCPSHLSPHRQTFLVRRLRIMSALLSARQARNYQRPH
jgi:hypothetical protein